MFRRRLFKIGTQAVRWVTNGEPGKTVQVLSGERGVNKATLLGRVGRAAEMRGTDERPVALFPLATSLSFKRPDGTYEQQTEWHRISVFKPGLRDWVVNSVKTGDRVFVSGSINYSTYETTSGDTVNATSIIADDVIRLTAKREVVDEAGEGDDAT